MKITILGAGAMGAALTVPLTDRGHEVALWCTDHDEATYDALTAGHPHPGLATALPGSIRIFSAAQIEEAMTGAELIVLGVSTPGILPVIRQAAPHLKAGCPILTTTKGFLSGDAEPAPIPSALERELKNFCPGSQPSILSMTGPSIAGELVRRQPTAAAIAGDEHGMAEEVCGRLETEYFWLDSIPDLKGLEICLAYKNIYSIGLAWAEGLYDSNDRASAQNLSAILLLQAVDEMRELVEKGHGNPDTAHGWSGLGDLVATAGGGRNGRFGRLLASGRSPGEAAEILEDEGVTTIEGRSATPPGVKYAAETIGDDWSARLPLLHSIHQVLDGGKSVREAIEEIHRFRKPN